MGSPRRAAILVTWQSPGRFFRRFAYWWRFRTQQDELREEPETHRALLAADLERRG